jgi:squalene-hopene/tetraprenyl-beta-curcumene cyclase
LTAHYTPDRNPDLTRRYGASGFQAGTQGLFYYYFVVAKALSTFGQTTLVTADGVSHDWAGEISSRLLRLEHDDGSWANSDAVGWESEPVPATSYALLTVKLCRATLFRPESKH